MIQREDDVRRLFEAARCGTLMISDGGRCTAPRCVWILCSRCGAIDACTVEEVLSTVPEVSPNQRVIRQSERADRYIGTYEKDVQFVLFKRALEAEQQAKVRAAIATAFRSACAHLPLRAERCQRRVGGRRGS